MSQARTEREYWRHGHSTETDFIYVTTQSLTYDALKRLSEDVGRKRTLLVCCKAFNAKEDAFDNLTLRKIPQVVLKKCEWGRDDYSLKIAKVAPPEEAGRGCDAETDADTAPGRDAGEEAHAQAAQEAGRRSDARHVRQARRGREP